MGGEGQEGQSSPTGTQDVEVEGANIESDAITDRDKTETQQSQRCQSTQEQQAQEQQNERTGATRLEEEVGCSAPTKERATIQETTEPTPFTHTHTHKENDMKDRVGLKGT